MIKIQQILQQYIQKKQTIILGISGGPDSIFLLNECLKLKKTTDIEIVLAHINHHLRGKDSDLDQKLVEKLAKKNSLKLEIGDFQKKAKGNLEEDARNFRYNFFEQLKKKHNATWILTAHHQDDSQETAIFNLIRGSYLTGLQGLDINTPQSAILRPLIPLTKEEILKHLDKEKIEYRIDKSNFDNQYSRNLIRNQIIPLFKQINPGFSKSFNNNLLQIKYTADFINNTSKDWLDKNSTMFLDDFLNLPIIIQNTILSTLYKSLYGSTNKFNQEHLKQILLMLNKRQSKLKKEFGDNYFIEVNKENANTKRIINIVKKGK